MNVYNSWSSRVLVVLSSQSSISMREANNSTLWVKIMSIKNEATLSSSLFSFWCRFPLYFPRDDEKSRHYFHYNNRKKKRKEKEKHLLMTDWNEESSPFFSYSFLFPSPSLCFTLPLFHSLRSRKRREENRKDKKRWRRCSNSMRSSRKTTETASEMKEEGRSGEARGEMLLCYADRGHSLCPAH